MEPLEEGEIAVASEVLVSHSLPAASPTTEDLVQFYNANTTQAENEKRRQRETIEGQTLPPKEYFRLQVTQDLHVVGVPHPTTEGKVGK